MTGQFAVLWLVGFCSYANVYLLLSVLPLYLQGWGLPDVAIGLLLGLMSGVSFVCRPLAGWLAESRGRRPFVVVGVAVLFIGTLGLPFARGILPFGVLRALTGVGWGNLTSNANTLAGETAPPGRRGEALGLYTMAGSVALAGGPAVGLLLASWLGYAAAFWVATAFAGLGLLATLRLRAPAQERRPLTRLGLRSLISREALGPALVLLLHAIMYGGLITFLPLLAVQRHLGNPGLFFAVYAIALLGLRSVAGRLSDRFGRVRVIVPGLACGSASLLLLAVSGNLLEMLAAALLFALAMGLVQPPALAWGMDLAPERRATAMATMVMAQDLGIILGGTLLGAVGTLASYSALFSIGAACGLVALGGLGTAWGLGRLSAPGLGDEHGG
ncbi:MAG: MFS transporter [Candidatus Dormibacteraceae bacterium]